MSNTQDNNLNVSIIIPVYNNSRTISDVLSSALSQKYPFGKIEIIVIDDFSKDESGEIIKNFPVKYFFNKKNIGLAKSLNLGISLSKFNYVITLHGDTIPVGSSWLQDLISPLDNADVGAVCSEQLSPIHTERILSIWEKMLYEKESIHVALNDKADAYKKSILQEIGLFDDETYRTAGEDEDLALRLILAGKKISGSPAKVIHDHYFKNNSILKNILNRELSFGKAGGALRRKFPFYKPKNYIITKTSNFTSDGSFRVILCVGTLIPYCQIFFIPCLFLAASMGILKIKKKKLRLLYPFFNISRFFMYTIGYIIGLIKGKQE